jgi:hypothetical protein
MPTLFQICYLCFVCYSFFLLLIVMFCVLFVCKCVLPQGVNQIAVHKYINIKDAQFVGSYYVSNVHLLSKLVMTGASPLSSRMPSQLALWHLVLNLLIALCQRSCF